MHHIINDLRKKNSFRKGRIRQVGLGQGLGLDETSSGSAARKRLPKAKVLGLCEQEGGPAEGVKGLRWDSRRRTSSQVYGATDTR